MVSFIPNFHEYKGYFSQIHIIGRISLKLQAKVGPLSGKGVYC